VSEFVSECMYVLLICLFCTRRSEYIIFQKILKLEYEFPDGFAPTARSIVSKLLVSIPLIMKRNFRSEHEFRVALF
jgi:hypothetical protein